jgi:hypothetical protein
MSRFPVDAVYRYWLAQSKARGPRKTATGGMGGTPMSTVAPPGPPAKGHAANDGAFDQAGGVPRGAAPALPEPSTRLDRRYSDYVDKQNADYPRGGGR